MQATIHHIGKQHYRSLDDWRKTGRFDPIPTGVAAGRFIIPNNTATTAINLVNGTMICYPFDVADPEDIDQILVECVTTPGGAGSVHRAGIYLDDGTFDHPGRLLSDAGTATTATTGVKTISATLTLPAGRLWMAVVQQGAPAPTATMRVTTLIERGCSVPSAAALAGSFPAVGGVTGALPDPCSTLNAASAFAYQTYLRAA